MNPKLRIALDSRNRLGMTALRLKLQARGHHVAPLDDFRNALAGFYLDPPDLVILDLSLPGEELRQFLKELKMESYFSPVPLVGLIQKGMTEKVEWKAFPVDDFIQRPINYPELFSRIDLSMLRKERVFDHNPLTRLPGNSSIQRAIERLLGQPVAVCYLDINHFKPYNDTYGFARGDEVINMVARIVSNVTKPLGENGFAGHIGGDDFVFIVPLEGVEEICQKVIDHFNRIVSDLFGEEERKRKYYVAKNRTGEEQRIPLLGVAIGVIPMNLPTMNHYGKIAEAAAGLKKYAKMSQESRFVFERRKT